MSSTAVMVATLARSAAADELLHCVDERAHPA
jgi:hypothetical protein